MRELRTPGSVQGVSGNRHSYRDQIFIGETYLQTELPIDPCSLSHWRKRLGEAGVEKLLAQNIEAAKRVSVIKPGSITCHCRYDCHGKAIVPPTDSALLEKRRVLLAKVARQYGLSLRQNYNRLAPRLVRQVAHYAHARRFKRMRRALPCELYVSMPLVISSSREY